MTEDLQTGEELEAIGTVGDEELEEEQEEEEIIIDDWEETHEDALVPEGEYDLLVAGITQGTSKAGDLQYNVRILIENPPEDVTDVAPIFHRMTFPSKGSENERFMKQQNKGFLMMLGVDGSQGFKPSDLLEIQFSCNVKVGKPYQGRSSNELQVPKFE